MKLQHHDLEIELPDDWWTDAGMSGFTPVAKSYRVDSNDCGNREVFEVLIEEIAPFRSNVGVGIFNDNKEATAKERVVSILKGFYAGSAIPPVEVVCEPAGSKFRYKLVAGVHRFYCSVAAGFSHVPAIEGFKRKERQRTGKERGRILIINY